MLKKVIREKDKEKLDMNVFKELGKDLNYKDILQVDGAFSACHINYGKSLKFNGADSKNMAQNSRKNSLTENGHIDDLEAVQYDFNGTEKDFKKQDIILLWEKYWLEYINAFNKLVAELPDSIVTVYVGRHAIELGFKYLMTKKNIKIEKDHDLKELYKKLDAVEMRIIWNMWILSVKNIVNILKEAIQNISDIQSINLVNILRVIVWMLNGYLTILH